MACHAHKDFDPKDLPENARPFAKANFGPNLSNVAAKFDEKNGFRWLANWLKAPENYHAKSLMPNLQLSWEESADIASYLLSVKADTIPARWDDPDFQVPPVDSPEVQKGLNDLATLYLGKAKVYKKRTVLLSEVESTVAGMTTDEKLAYVGEKTINRLGCFGCHNIAGFENAKPIGTPLNGWGIKSPSKLDFGHIAEYLTDHFRLLDPKTAEQKAEKVAEGTPKLPTEGGGAIVAKGHAGRGLRQDPRLRRHRRVLQGTARRPHPHGLPLPEAPPPPVLRLRQEQRGPQELGRAPPHAPVLVGERQGRHRGGHDVRPGPHGRAHPRQVPAQIQAPRRRPWRRAKSCSTATTAGAATSWPCPGTPWPRAPRRSTPCPTS